MTSPRGPLRCGYCGGVHSSDGCLERVRGTYDTRERTPIERAQADLREINAIHALRRWYGERG